MTRALFVALLVLLYNYQELCYHHRAPLLGKQRRFLDDLRKCVVSHICILCIPSSFLKDILVEFLFGLLGTCVFDLLSCRDALKDIHSTEIYIYECI